MQDPRRIGVRAEHAHRFARLDEQRLVVLERAQRGDDLLEALPVARRFADAAVDDQFLGALGDLGVEVVHEHAQRRFGEPAAAAISGGPRGARSGARVCESDMVGYLG